MTKIIVVDDNEQNRYILKLLLEGLGYQVVPAQNGIAALETAHASPPDLIISDILMPGMDGFSLCRQWKTDEQLKGIPFIFYTATYTDPKDEDFALSLGAERFVRKPAEVEELAYLVKEVLDEYKKKKLKPVQEPITEEKVFFKKYNEALIRKMEDKMMELEQVNKRLSTLFQTSIDLTASISQDELLSFISDRIIVATGCTHVAYFEQKDGSTDLRLKAGSGFSPKDFVQLQRDWKFSSGMEKGWVGKIGQTHESLVINKDFSDPVWMAVIPSIRSALFLPAVYEDHLMGVWAFLSNAEEKFNEKIVRDLVTIVNNVTVVIEKNHLFEQIKQSEFRYRTLVETSIDAIATINDNEIITDWSRGAEEIFGYTKQERIGYPPDALLPEENKKLMEGILKETKEKGFVQSLETQLLTKDGRLLDVEMTFTYMGKELGSTIILRDITRRKKAEQFITALNRAAVATATTLTPAAIYFAVAAELDKLGLACALLSVDNIKSNVFSTFFSVDFSQRNKLPESQKVCEENFSLPLDAVVTFNEVVQKRESVFVKDIERILETVPSQYIGQIPAGLNRFPRHAGVIVTPLIVENTVLGIFFVQSKNLTGEDVPTITAFANQLAAAWAKTRLAAKLQQTMNGVIRTIALIVEMRDPYTAGHQKRVGDLAATIAIHLRLSADQIEGVRIAGIIHDLGKIAIPAEILSKPGKLSIIEYNLVKMHSQVGFDMLKNIEFPWPLAQIVYQHHERMNGTGYPSSIKGEDILLEARIIGVADVVEAMSSHRPYRPALGFDAARKEITANKGILYDEDVVNACLDVFEVGYQFPAADSFQTQAFSPS